MLIGTARTFAVILSLLLGNGQIVDGSKSHRHQTVLIESQFSLPDERNQFPVSSCHWWANIRRFGFLRKAQSSLRERQSSSFVQLRLRKPIISGLPCRNCERFLHFESMWRPGVVRALKRE